MGFGGRIPGDAIRVEKVTSFTMQILSRYRHRRLLTPQENAFLDEAVGMLDAILWEHSRREAFRERGTPEESFGEFAYRMSVCWMALENTRPAFFDDLRAIRAAVVVVRGWSGVQPNKEAMDKAIAYFSGLNEMVRRLYGM